MIVILISLLCITYLNGYKFRPRCSNDFLFPKNKSNKNQEQYFNSWKRECKEDLKIACSKNITISYYEMKPFSSDKDISHNQWPAVGMLQQIVGVMLSQCCGNCINITYNKVENRSILIDSNTKEASDIIFPVFTHGQATYINSSIPDFTLPIIQLSSAMFITKSIINAKIFTMDVVSAIIDIWPLLGVSLLLAFAAGVLIWILDTWSNREHFPRHFLPGSFEGFWWAFVSMTTVGYGDRTPKSIMGRLFAMFWILCGLTIVALMTAALTTAISTVSFRQKPSVYNGKIGILQDHVFEKFILSYGNADKKYAATVAELVTLMNDHTIEGFLLDTFTSKSTLSYQYLKQNNMYVDKLIHDRDQSYLGISIFDEELYNLLEEYYKFEKDQISDYILEIFLALQDIHDKRIIANLLFTTGSGVFYPTLYVCGVILLLTLLIGCIYELCKLFKKKQSKNSKIKVMELNDIITQEKKLEVELRKLLQNWKHDLSSNMKQYSVQGVFNICSTSETNLLIKLSTITNEKQLSFDTTLLNYSDVKKMKQTKGYDNDNNNHVNYQLFGKDYSDGKVKTNTENNSAVSECEDEEEEEMVKKKKTKRKSHSNHKSQDNIENQGSSILTLSEDDELAIEKKKKKKRNNNNINTNSSKENEEKAEEKIRKKKTRKIIDDTYSSQDNQPMEKKNDKKKKRKKNADTVTNSSQDEKPTKEKIRKKKTVKMIDVTYSSHDDQSMEETEKTENKSIIEDRGKEKNKLESNKKINGIITDVSLTKIKTNGVVPSQKHKQKDIEVLNVKLPRGHLRPLPVIPKDS